MKLISKADGTILYANAAFREWSEYTLSELMKIGWIQLSVDDESLEADLLATKTLTDGYVQASTVRKKYRKKSGESHWGILTVIRYPPAGNVEWFACTWEPLKNGTATAFAMAMEHTQKLDARIEAMTVELKAITTQTDEDKFVLGAIRMVQRHPKMAAAFIVMALSIFGLNNVVELLQRTGLVNLPVKVTMQEQVGGRE
jgi:PAS domain S-box-containing protein